MKVLHLTTTYPVNDNDPTAVFLKNLISSFSNTIDAYVLTPDTVYEDTQRKVFRFRYWFKKYQSLTHDIAIMSKIRKNPLLIFLVPFMIISAAYHLQYYCKKLKIDFIHAHWLFPMGTVAVLLKKLKLINCKVIITSHGGDIYSLNKGLFYYCNKFTARNADQIIAVGSPIAEKLNKEFNVSSEIIPMGTDPEIFYPDTRSIPDIENYFLFVGRLEKSKGIGVLLEAYLKYISSLVSEKDAPSLVIIGDGPYRPITESFIKEHQLDYLVSLPGKLPQQQLRKYYSNAICTIIPTLIGANSSEEGFGLVAVEAHLCKCPVIASRIGGLTDIIRDGESGLLFEMGNIESLKNALIQITDNTLRNHIAISGYKQSFNNFSINSLTYLTEKVYKSLFIDL